MKHKPNTKISRVNLRITPQEIKLIRMMAQKEGLNLSEYLRNVVLTIAESSVESREFLNSVSDNNKDNAVQILKGLILENKDTTANSIKGVFDALLDRFDKVERLIDVFIYVFLYHTPEVIDTKKKQAKDSAVERLKKTLALIDDKQMLGTITPEPNYEKR